MADTLSREQRSRVMAAIKSRGNKRTELLLIAILRDYSITGWLRNQNLPGRPDFAFRRQRLAVFVDGCFWHGCRWHCRMPKSRKQYWEPKIQRNIQRDKLVRTLLAQRGWKVLRIWEHQLKCPERVALTLARALREHRK
ncbi:MAG TPA: very short patch repair endonuclease [Candidatus Hydrogenedentes bacterium]|nr:very short patch repair endonuclease [Candidatus Hydrogenedentota bacterium]